MKKYFESLPRVAFGRNGSYLESVKLGLFNGVVWAPYTLWNAIKMPLAGIGIGLFGLFVALFVFTYVRVAVVAAGLLGYLLHNGWGYGDAGSK